MVGPKGEKIFFAFLDELDHSEYFLKKYGKFHTFFSTLMASLNKLAQDNFRHFYILCADQAVVLRTSRLSGSRQALSGLGV